MDYLVTFLEGIITFVSPCILPMLPIYVAYFAGDAESASNHQKTGKRHRSFICALGFVAGFTILFVVLGAFAGSVGSSFVEHQAVLNVVCGIIVILLGLNYLGILRIPALQKTLKPRSSVIPRSFWSSLLFGIVFAVGWTPCVGAFLGSALSLAATSGHLITGIILLLCYSIGLGIPFLVVAVLIEQLEGAFGWVKRHYAVIDRICGTLLVVVGVLMATGLFGVWLRMLSP